MNVPIYLGLSILEITKIVMYEFHMITLSQNMGKKLMLIQTAL